MVSTVDWSADQMQALYMARLHCTVFRLCSSSSLFSFSYSIQEWAGKNTDCGGIESRPPLSGNRIVVQLFWDVAPLACENFATLCANGSSFPNNKPKPAPMGESGKPLTYRNSQIHRVIPGFVLQGGDFVFGNGSGGESVFGNKKCFKDERAGLALTHNGKGVLSMGNSGKNSNSSQFFFTLDKAPQCDGKHVIFGKVVSGWEVLQAAEAFGSTNGQPTVPITITDCGIFTTTPPLLEMTPGCGYWFDKPDPESYSGISPVFMVRPRVAVLAPTHAVISKFQAAMGPFVSLTAVSAEGMEEDESAQASRLVELVGTFSVDVVIIAPACKGVKSVLPLQVSKAWEAMGISMDEIFLEAKPVEALDAVRTKSWLAKQSQWQLDGA